MKSFVIALTCAALSVGMTGALTTTASAQKIDATGKCHAADGKLAKMEVCKPAAKPAKGVKCQDPKTKKFAKCDAPGAVPMAAKAAPAAKPAKK